MLPLDMLHPFLLKAGPSQSLGWQPMTSEDTGKCSYVIYH